MRSIHRATFHALCVVASMELTSAIGVRAADHLDSPSVQNNHSLDINDLYAFPRPSNPDNIVLIMTGNPLAGVLSGTAFSSFGNYEFGVDNNGDAVPDKTFTVYFSAARKGVQNVLFAGMNVSASCTFVRRKKAMTCRFMQRQ